MAVESAPFVWDPCALAELLQAQQLRADSDDLRPGSKSLMEQASWLPLQPGVPCGSEQSAWPACILPAFLSKQACACALGILQGVLQTSRWCCSPRRSAFHRRAAQTSRARAPSTCWRGQARRQHRLPAMRPGLYSRPRVPAPASHEYQRAMLTGRRPHGCAHVERLADSYSEQQRQSVSDQQSTACRREVKMIHLLRTIALSSRFYKVQCARRQPLVHGTSWRMATDTSGGS